MKQAKRTLTLLLTAFMIFALLPQPAMAAAVRLEAENAITAGGARVATGQAGASGGSVVGYFSSATASSVTFAGLQAASGVVIGYSSIYTGTISIYLNTTHVRDAAVAPTGGWTGAGHFQTIVLDIDINSGDSLRLQCDAGDVALNVDYLEYSPLPPIAANGTITASGAYVLSGDNSNGAITINPGLTVTLAGAAAACTNLTISCGAGVKLTVRNVKIDNSAAEYSCPLSFTGAGNTLTLAGDNTLKGGYRETALKAEDTTQLTIRGSGSLTATGGEFSAGIGGAINRPGGIITIDSGTVTAIGGNNAPGIGGGHNFSGGITTINGGTVTATGGTNGAGIGGGNTGGSGTVSINGGTVTAAGGSNAAGIGNGNGVGAVVGPITISGGTVTATGGSNAAGIGGGGLSAGGAVTISGGTVKATGGSNNAPGIGGGRAQYITDSGTLKNGDGVDVYLTTILLVGTYAKNAAVSSLAADLEDTYGLNDVFSDSSGKLYLYLPLETITTNVGISNGSIFSGNATTAASPTTFEFLIADLPPNERITADFDSLVWDAIKGHNSVQTDVKAVLTLPKAGESGTTIAWSASPTGFIDTDTGAITRPLDSARTVTLSATVSYPGGTAKTKSFTLTVPVNTGRFEAEDAIIVNGSIFSGAEGAGASGGEHVGNLNVRGSSSVQWNGLPASSVVEIRYASQNNGKISVYKNGEHIQDVPFTPTGGWYGEGRFASLWLSLEIAAGDSLKIQYDDGDAVLNLDYLGCDESLFENATISPASVTFDKIHPADVTTTVNWNNASAVTDVKVGGASIGAANYSLSGNTLTVKKDYLATLPAGETALTVKFQPGASATLTVNITESFGTTIAADGTYNLSDCGNDSTIKINTGLTVTLQGAAATYTNVLVYCEAGVKLTLNNVNIDNSADDDIYAISFTGEGNTLTLAGTNTLKGGVREPGLKVEGATQLTIRGSGLLTSTGGGYSAGIGGAINRAGGILTIDGGTVTAIGGSNAAGIGGGHNYSGGATTINGGTVTATGGQYGAGIGGGNTGGGGNTMINGGAVTATGGLGSAGIGGGHNTTGGSTATINGGTVKATGGSLGAGIGGGGANVVGNVPGIGTVTINGGTVEAKGGGSGAGIGGGGANGTSAGGAGVVTITGGTITASGGGAGIGGGNTLGAYYSGGAGVVTITGGSVNAASTGGAANIGGGKGSSGSTLKNATGADVYLTTIKLSDSSANNAAVSWLTTNLAYTYGLNGVFSDNLGKLYLYLPQGTVTTKVGVPNGNIFSGNAATTATPATFEFLLSALTPDMRIEAAIALLDWNTIKGGNSAENDVKTPLTLITTGTNGTTVTWSASPAGIINTDTGALTRQLADKTVVLTATVSYAGATAKTKSFTLTVPATTGKFEAEDAVTNARVYGDAQAVGASGGKQVGSISTVGKYVQWNNLPASAMVEVRYASPNNGTISLYKNDTPLQDVLFASTGDWYGEGCFGSLWLPLEIASGDSLRVQYDTGDAILNLDYLACYASLINNAVISPASLTFDKTHPADVTTAVEWNDATSVTGVKAGGTSIGADGYSVSGNTLTIRKEYLASLPVGELVLTVSFQRGNPATLTVNIIDTGNITADGTYNLADYGNNCPITINSGLTVTLTGDAAITYTNVSISCGAGVSLTLSNVKINNSAVEYSCALAFSGAGNTLTLAGSNTLAGGYRETGLKVEEPTQLTIRGDGSLTSTGGEFSAGIGGAINRAGGVLTIDSGTVTAVGGKSASGIGGGHNYSGGSVTINGGSVTATGGQYGAGIGGGYTGSNGGTVTINGGSVTANGGDYGAGIGGGRGSVGGTVGSNGNGATVVISGGTVTATGGDDFGTGAGIGGGERGHGGTVTISGGTVTATGSVFGAGIGGGWRANGGNVTISGGTVTATGGRWGAGIGGGDSGNGGNVTISGGTVIASYFMDGVTIGGGDGATDHGTLKNGDGVDVYLTPIRLWGSGAANAAVSSLTADLTYTYGLKDVFSDSLGWLYLYLPLGTKTTQVGTPAEAFTGNAVTGNSPTVFDFAVNASISPATGAFDRNPEIAANVTTAITWNGASSVTDVKRSGATIGEDSYEVDGDTLTIRKAYLATLPVGDFELAVCFNVGASATLTVTVTDTTPPVCAIDTTPYTDLGAALSAVGAGETKTVTLLTDSVYNAGITVENRTVIFDLNGHTLHVINGGGHALEVGEGGVVDIIGEGAFNTASNSEAGCGVAVHGGGRATVTNAEATGSGFMISGAAAFGSGSIVKVKGSVKGASDGIGVCAVSGGAAEVSGDVEGGTGVAAIEGSSVHVKGNVTANTYGVITAGAGTVTVDQTLKITGDGAYITLEDTDKAEGDGVMGTGDDAGYLVYSDDSGNVVRVKAAAGAGLPFTITPVSSSISGGVLNIVTDIINSGGADTEAVVTIAIFDDSGKMIDIKTFPAVYSSAHATPVSHSYACGDQTDIYFKVFVFEDPINIKPLAALFSSR